MAGGAAPVASPRTSVAVGADSPPESTESMSLTIAALSAKSAATFADGAGGAGGGGPELGAGEPASTLSTRPAESSSRASASWVWSSLIDLGGTSLANRVSWQMRQRARVSIPCDPGDPRSSVGHVGAAARWYRRPDAREAAVLPGHRRPNSLVVEMTGSQGDEAPGRRGGPACLPVRMRPGPAMDRVHVMSNAAATLICITVPLRTHRRRGSALSRARLNGGL